LPSNSPKCKSSFRFLPQKNVFCFQMNTVFCFQKSTVFAFKPGGYIAKQLSEMQVVIQVFASKKRVLLSNEHSVLLSKEHTFCFQTGRVPLRSLRTNYQKCKSSFRSRACKGCLAVCWHSSKVPTVGRHRWRGVLLCTSL
jgi:hypothetical protein